MNWIELKDRGTLQQIVEDSKNHFVLIFKHSFRCSTSALAINRLERSWNVSEMENVQPYYLDLIRYREISNELASVFGVEHQSPQVVIIKNGTCVYHTSHFGINYEDIRKLSEDISVN